MTLVLPWPQAADLASPIVSVQYAHDDWLADLQKALSAAQHPPEIVKPRQH